MNISVIVPTYRRPHDLQRCLEALSNQVRLADEIVVVVRDADRETWSFLKDFTQEKLPLKTATAIVSGQVAALNSALKAAVGDIIAITDDDGVPHSEWLSRIEAHFCQDREIGGVGGRDWMYIGNQLIEGQAETVGKVQWFGRTIGNHHLGVGQPREVEILKGANMSYRRTAIADLKFDTRLLGSGAEVHNDLAFALTVKRRGWKLLYDPLVEIDHYHGKRFDEDERGKFNQVAWFNEVYNETLTLLDYLPPLRRVIFFLWSIMVGTRRGYGIVQWVRFLPQEGVTANQKWFFSLKGRVRGLIAWLQSKNLSQPNLLKSKANKSAIDSKIAE